MTTEATATYGKADALGFDPAEGVWVAVCKQHNMHAGVATRDAARAAIRDSASFCEDCAADKQDASDPGWDDDFSNPSDPITFPAARNLEDDREVAEKELPIMTEEEYTAFEAEVHLQMEEIHPMEDGSDLGAVAPSAQALDDALADLGDMSGMIDTSGAQPTLGTFRGADGVPHNATSISGMYFHTVCDQSMMMGDAAEPTDSDMCTYCLSGVPVPKNAPVKAKGERVARVKKEKPEPEPEPEPKYSAQTLALASVIGELEAILRDDPSVADARVALRMLEATTAWLKPILPRRRVGVVTGARSGLVKQSASVKPSPELERAKEFADAGDVQAQRIVEHASAYQPGADCSYCLAHHGTITRHGYATAFTSIGRQLKAMEHRAAARASA